MPGFDIRQRQDTKVRNMRTTLKQLSLHYNLGLDAANERNLFRNLANQ